MNPLILRLLAALVLVTGLVAGGYHWGSTATTNDYKAAELDKQKQAEKLREAAHRRGDVAVSNLVVGQMASEERYHQLEGAFNDLKNKRHVPLLVSAPSRCPPTSIVQAPARRIAAVAAPGFQPAQPAVVAAAPVEPPPPVGVPPLDAGTEQPMLSLGAVWMWNSALAGRDSPAGTCGLVDSSGQADTAACAPTSGVSIDQAFDNHTDNARSCALDRARFNALIDFLEQRDPSLATNHDK